jgi:hypothetical protein
MHKSAWEVFVPHRLYALSAALYFPELNDPAENRTNQHLTGSAPWL